MESSALIEFERITVMRGTTIALNEVSLRIGVGEHVAILGPNGCGKSTLIKAITRECYPLIREGSSMRILGKELWNVAELRTSLDANKRSDPGTTNASIVGRIHAYRAARTA